MKIKHSFDIEIYFMGIAPKKIMNDIHKICVKSAGNDGKREIEGIQTKQFYIF